MIDTHTHTKFSFDGKSSLAEMLARAESLCVEYYAVTEHCDMDYNYIPEYYSIKRLNINKYVAAIKEAKEKYPFLALGIELGYSKEAVKDYLNLPLEEFDYILNSTHTVDGKDCYGAVFFKGKSKKESYGRYLATVRESLEIPYNYNTVSHLGFIKKNAPFEDKNLNLDEFGDIIEDILKRIIELDKSLEFNSHTRGHGFMPDFEIIKRYKELGGEKLCYASDAHIVSRICENYDLACELAKNAGFDYWTVYRKQKPIKIKI